MRARAPGKIVLSGAYAVLEGAPGVVAAVDRYVVADTASVAGFVTEELRAALGDRAAPSFDASQLREGERKLGLGSSAAILVASLAALELERAPGLAPEELAARVFEPALAAHAQAQGGGSGIDVAASAHGGILEVTRTGAGLSVRRTNLPAGVRVWVWSLGRSASTRELIEQVRALSSRDPQGYSRCLNAQAEASVRAARALDAGDAASLIGALIEQARSLAELGKRSGAPIVTPEVAALSREAEAFGAAVLPAGAGGGDVALWVGSGAPPSFKERSGMIPLPMRLGVKGVHAIA